MFDGYEHWDHVFLSYLSFPVELQLLLVKIDYVERINPSFIPPAINFLSLYLFKVYLSRINYKWKKSIVERF
jgi:hypothetical protein